MPLRSHYLISLCLGLLLQVLSAGELRIATYNVENYLVMDRRVGKRWMPDYPKPENEKQQLRQMIREISPDVLVMQEIGGKAFLEELRADLALEGSCYEYAICLDAADSERHVAVLSKLPPLQVVEHTDLDFKYFEEREVVKRGMLELSFEPSPDCRFKLFALHLKSRFTVDDRDPQSELRRTREAEACRDRLIERTHDLEETCYLVAGDFNDHPDSAPLRRFYKRGDLELGTLLPVTDSRDERWTHYYEKEALYEWIDGFVVSPELLPKVEDGRGHIVDSPGSLEASDHRMVYFDLSYE